MRPLSSHAALLAEALLGIGEHNHALSEVSPRIFRRCSGGEEKLEGSNESQKEKV